MKFVSRRIPCHGTLKASDYDIDPAYPVELTILTYKLHDSSNPESLKDFVNWSYDRHYGWKKLVAVSESLMTNENQTLVDSNYTAWQKEEWSKESSLSSCRRTDILKSSCDNYALSTR